ncbi:hypothetical protein ACR78F_19255 [Sphingobacterium spiritivorum]|uniref:hypothetical protein n=1 Tax=Sphingobacterium spiritivorum TaxID=258 RepID=UPI003DA5DEEC
MATNFRTLILSIFFITISYLSYAQEQDTLYTDPDTATYDEQIDAAEELITKKKQHPYWEEGYYNKVPRIHDIPAVDTAEFNKMFKKYQSEEFLYNEKVLENINFLKRLKNRINDLLSSILPDFYFENPEWMYKLIGAVFVVLLVYVLYRLIFTGKKLYTVQEKEDDEDANVAFVERNLLQVDVHTFVEQALKEENYSLAIRYLNLLNIQTLAKKELVKWNYTKTNIELMNEMDNTELRKEFEACSNVFNYVWFGNFPVTKENYEQYATLFREFQTKWS